jgi:hypothetical protein
MYRPGTAADVLCGITGKRGKQNGQAFDDAMAHLRYGAIGINAWTGMAFALATWGSLGTRSSARPTIPSQIQATRRYLTDARQLLESSDSAEAFYDAMPRRHPDRLNPGALWGAAITLFPPH